MNLGKIDLIGHSFGGYVVAKYAKKYTEFIRKLVLLSPLGVIT